MFDETKLASRNRAILTETLPYEVPVIFSNDRFFRTSTRQRGSPAVQAALLHFSGDPGTRTIPYNYKLKKGRERYNVLSVMHPLWQLKVAHFYDDYANSLLLSCLRSEYSLRRPTSIPGLLVGGLTVDLDSRYKSGLVQLGIDAPEGEETHLTSYFVYGKYNLLGRFVDSQEYIRHEKRFSRMRRIDISRCFFSIYTHSIAWALKDKIFAKDNSDSYSLENRFDRLMQGANWGETNGILVGPEISRIFAEIILQRVDQDIFTELSDQRVEHGWDYAIRRYVDDYFIFANSDEMVGRLTELIQRKLEPYKLYINDGKTRDLARPFVSELTKAKSEIRAEFRELRSAIRSDAAPENPSARRSLSVLRAEVKGLRNILSTHGVDVSEVSGIVLPAIRQIVGRQNWLETEGEAPPRHRLETALSLLGLAFYICALDPRVRCAYTLSQIVLEVQQAEFMAEAHSRDMINHLIVDECAAIIRRLISDGSLDDRGDSVELYNFLICGATFVGEDFLRNKTVREALDVISLPANLTYFRYITAKYCMLKSRDEFSNMLLRMNKRVRELVISRKSSINTDAETYLLFSDYISSPDISTIQKRSLINQRVSAKEAVSIGTAEGVSRLVGFVDWEGLSVIHLLERKRLRQPYQAA